MLTYPVNLKEIDKFERKNNVSVNVFTIDENANTVKHVNEKEREEEEEEEEEKGKGEEESQGNLLFFFVIEICISNN